MKQKYKKQLGWAIKIAIVVFTFLFLYSKINNDKSLRELHAIIGGLNATSVTIIFTSLILLMALNWLSEAYKWQLMMDKVQKISYWSSLQTIVCGISLGTITPGRVGDL
ncbi:MAG: hypothetical protein ACQUHE_16625, partial [Bacteroidia bacterium]